MYESNEENKSVNALQSHEIIPSLNSLNFNLSGNEPKKKSKRPIVIEKDEDDVQKDEDEVLFDWVPKETNNRNSFLLPKQAPEFNLDEYPSKKTYVSHSQADGERKAQRAKKEQERKEEEKKWTLFRMSKKDTDESTSLLGNKKKDTKETTENTALLDTKKKPSFMQRFSLVPSAFQQNHSLTPAELEEAQSGMLPLTRLLWYHIKQNDYPRFEIRRDGTIIALSIIVSGASLILYWGPTWTFALQNSELFGKDITAAMLEAGVNIANFNLSAEAVSQLLSNLLGRGLPDYVKKAINEKGASKFKAVLKHSGFALLSLLAALPFGAFVQGSMYEKLLVEITTAIIINYGLDNILLSQYRGLQQKFTRNQQKRAIFKIKKYMTYNIEMGIREIVKSKKIPPHFTPHTTKTPDELMREFATFLGSLGIAPKQDLSWTQFIFRKLFPIIVGAHIPFMGMVGYNLNLFDTLSQYIPNKVLALIIAATGASVFQYIAMCAAALTFMDILDVITCKSEPSLAKRLYPAGKIILDSFMIISALLSFGTSEYSIANNPHFNGQGFLAALRVFFLIYGFLSPALFNGFGGLNFSKNVLEKFAEFWGRIDRKQKAHLALQMREFVNNINHEMSDLKFLESLENLPDDVRQKLVNLPFYENLDLLIKIAKGEISEADVSKHVYLKDVKDFSNIMSNSSQTKYQKIPEPQRQEIKQEYLEDKISLDQAQKKIKTYGSTSALGVFKSKFWSKPNDNTKPNMNKEEATMEEAPEKKSRFECNMM